MEQVDRLESSGDVTGLVQVLLDPGPDLTGQAALPTANAKEGAADALAELGTPEALDALIGALGRAPQLRYIGARALARALASVEGPRALEALVDMASHHEHPEVRAAAAGALADHLDDLADRRDDVLAVLLSVLADRESVRREMVHSLLVGLRLRDVTGDPPVVELLTRALADSDARVREYAADGLRITNDPRATEALRTVAEDPDERVRKIAEETSGVLGAALRPEVRTLAETRGWPHLWLGTLGSPVKGLASGAVGGLVIGTGILAILTRGSGEGVLELLRGGGGGLGLIIVAVAVLALAALGLADSWLSQVKAGQEAWDGWLASAGVDSLKKARDRMAKQAKSP